ncbi:MAG: archaemetzincin family Zn-dependent metalloprotease [Candidatus Bathyarchaeia archaeon]
MYEEWQDFAHLGKFRIGILRIGSVDAEALKNIQSHLFAIFPETTCTLLEETMPIPEDAYNKGRSQYHSSRILEKIGIYTKKFRADRVLGITEVDLYVPQLNFVFGEAQCPGKAAIISLYRLKPEFYGQPPNRTLFLERSVKEAVHEVGHTLGLGHCGNPACVMFFSNNIQMVDTKSSSFCETCYGRTVRLLKEGAAVSRVSP